MVMHILSLLHTNVSWPRLAVRLSLDLHLLWGIDRSLTWHVWLSDVKMWCTLLSETPFIGCKWHLCLFLQEKLNRSVLVLEWCEGWIPLKHFGLTEQAKCCWVTGVADRILDSFCLVLIGSILNLSLLIRSRRKKARPLGRFYFQNKMAPSAVFSMHDFST